MEYTFLVVTLVLVVGVAYVAQSIGKIKRAREAGKKLSKRSYYYALITRLFVRDLPD